MEGNRRMFIKSLGLGSGALLMDPVTIFGKRPEEDVLRQEIGKIDKRAYVTREYETDVLIAGGGMSGVCAALAAARNGAKVILIQDRSRLGGNASSEIRMHIVGASAIRQGVWRETGILEELVLTEAVENQQRCYEIWDHIMYDRVMSEKNITLLLDTVFYEADVSRGKVNKIKAICSPTEEIYEIKAKHFADCTGDGTLAAMAGAEFMQGREATSLWNESLGQPKADMKTMGNSILFMSQKHDIPMPYTPPKWARKYSAKDFVHRKINSWEFGYWWIELGGMEDAVKDGQKIRHDLLSVVYGIWDYIKNSGNHPESENWALSWVGMLNGKRESRRIVGDYIMKQDDIQSPKLFEDRVAYGGWPLDDHPPEGIDNTGVSPYRSIPLTAPYSIPLRSLYAKGFNNLFMAGRNVSVSHVALSSTRVMATCANMGQAVGTAMAYCTQNNIPPNVLSTDKNHIAKLQQILLRQDQGILGVENNDTRDVARSAKVKASVETTDGPAASVIDGYNRDVKDGKSHQWRAGMNGGSPWIELSWGKPVQFNNIQLVFDTGLHRTLRLSGDNRVYNMQERHAQPETVADYSIEARLKNKMVPLVKVEGNYMRLVEHSFDTTQADAIRITVSKTNGDALARIFEVRCYMEGSEVS
jgi:hypothetical protein